jgi:YVTN family beta-propeller protein
LEPFPQQEELEKHVMMTTMPRRALLQGLGLSLASLPIAARAQTPAAPAGVLQRDLAQGLYEVAFSPAQNALFVAVAGGFRDGLGGQILRLEPRTLETQATIPLAQKPFALALNHVTGILYAGNTMDRAITAIDTATNRVTGALRLDSPENLRPRQIRIDEVTNTLFIGGVEEPSMVWIVDGASFTLRSAIRNTGRSATGLAFDPVSKRLYLGNNDAEVLIAHPSQARILSRHSVGDGQKRFLVNLDIDPIARRLYVAEANQRDVLVFDAESGRFLQRITTAKNPLAVLVDAPRKRAFVTNRGAGVVSIIDTASGTVARTVELGFHPNSLALESHSGAAFVTVKKPMRENQPGYLANALDVIVRIEA